MAKGGRREGAGRKPGVPNRKTQALQEQIAAQGLTPLDYLMSLVRNDGADLAVRLDAAKAAAPYVHPRLAAIEHSGGVAISHEDALAALG